MDFVSMKFVLEMKLYFVTCVYFIAVIESLEAFNQQEQRSLSCISDLDNYICYSPENGEVFSVKREQMDELLSLSEKTLNMKNDMYDFDVGTEAEKDYGQLTTHTDEKQQINTIPFSKRSTERRMSLIEILSYMKKWWYPYEQKHSPYRKRPFDSISYRGQFGGFGRR